MPASARLNPAAQEPPLDPRVAREAAQWLMRVHPAAEPGENELRACQQWRASHAEHELAWQRAQQLNAKFGIMPPMLGKAALGRSSARSPGQQRRAAVKKLALLLTVAPASLLAYRQLPLDTWRADHRTATGERRSIQLADGSHVQMNTGSAFDAVYDDTQRLLILHEGELLIETARDSQSPARPFRVQTADGRIRAIGTRFTVKRIAAWSDVAVFDGAVEVQARDDATQTRILAAHHQLRLSATHLGATEALVSHGADWTRGILHADNQRLADFSAELARHRRGWIRCDPAVADLRISGSFRLDDTDGILRALVGTLPVRITLHTRYWVTIHPA